MLVPVQVAASATAAGVGVSPKNGAGCVCAAVFSGARAPSTDEDFTSAAASASGTSCGGRCGSCQQCSFERRLRATDRYPGRPEDVGRATLQNLVAELLQSHTGMTTLVKTDIEMAMVVVASFCRRLPVKRHDGVLVGELCLESPLHGRLFNEHASIWSRAR